MNEMNSQQPQQPSKDIIINVQKQEIDRLNDNRVYLIAMLEETKSEANVEINRLLGVISQLKGMMSEDVVEEAERIISQRGTNERELT